MSGSIRVLIADDHRLVRAGLSELLHREVGIDVIGEVGDGEAVLEMAPRLRPDVILMDVQMPRLGGIEATRRLNATQPEARVIAVSAFDVDPVPARIMEAGAWGFLGKGAEPAEVVTAVRRVAAGERHVPPALAKRLALAKKAGDEQGQFRNLSRRELELVLYTARGLGTLAVAQRLSLSPKTVSTYRRRVYDKLGVDNDIDLIKLAAGHGLITIEVPSTP